MQESASIVLVTVFQSFFENISCRRRAKGLITGVIDRTSSLTGYARAARTENAHCSNSSSAVVLDASAADAGKVIR